MVFSADDNAPRSVGTARAPSVTRPVSADAAGMRKVGGALVLVDRMFRVFALHPKADGVWRSEADKLVWRDGCTGLDCIILRAGFGGHLRGFVGIGPDHAMHGMPHEVIPEPLMPWVHGGLDFSGTCDEDRPEHVAICRDRSLAGRDPLWWYGFSCDRPGDVVPDRTATPAPDAVVPPLYRDMAYVFEQCTGLAAQLQAIDEGDSPFSVEVTFPAVS